VTVETLKVDSTQPHLISHWRTNEWDTDATSAQTERPPTGSADHDSRRIGVEGCPSTAKGSVQKFYVAPR